jgi:hypothetical protein
MKHKKRSKKQNLFHFPMRGNILIPLLFIIVAFGVLLTSGAMVNKSATDPAEQYGEATVQPGPQQQNLQLKNLTFKQKPTPANDSCNHDNGKPIVNSGEQYDPTTADACKCLQYVIECKDRRCSKYISLGGNPQPTVPAGGPPCGTEQASFDTWCQSSALTSGDGTYCLGKPVIYLYPEKTMPVKVTIKTTGKIVVSDPLYPEGGWDVIANPNGQIVYQGKSYTELFYESETRALSRPKAGIIMDRQNLKEELSAFITRLGLTKADEQKEFLEWWIPRLNALNSPYVFVSILDKQEKARLDKVDISPKPDTFIDFIVYFKPLNSPIDIQPLNLPQAPKRTGFTAIEWGGVIDN